MVSHWYCGNVGQYNKGKIVRKKIASALFMDVKEVFDNISRDHLLKHIIDLGIKDDLGI